ncbi:MAG: hypothetical protein MJZ38_00835 [archaeon]|nr:hypothetical protein [archaeon]
MAEINTSTDGLYRISHNSEKPGIITVEWGGSCIGILRPAQDRLESVIGAIDAGKSIREVWKILDLPVDPIDTTLPIEPYFVFACIDDLPVQLYTSNDLEDAQEFAKSYLEGTRESLTLYVCFVTGRYYRDGSISCIHNIMSRGEPRKNTPFKKVLGMDVDCFHLMFEEMKEA